MSLKALSDRSTKLGPGGSQRPFSWNPERPLYPGLLAFEEEDAAIYFGRDDEISHLIELLIESRTQGAQKLIAVVGATGSGKSSLLRAGIIPRLKSDRKSWIVLPTIRPGGRPLYQLADCLAMACGEGLDRHSLRGVLYSGNVAAILDSIAHDLRIKEGSPSAQIVLAVDQGEELFHAFDEEARRFLEILTDILADDQYLPVMTLRSDSLVRLKSVAGIATLIKEFWLGPMPLIHMVDIIEGPARVASVDVQIGFIVQAILDAKSPDALPLLALALNRLHRQMYSIGALTLDGWNALGDAAARLTPIENAVRQTVEEILHDVRPNAEELAALHDALVYKMVEVNELGAYSRRRAGWGELPRAAHRLLNQLSNFRLLIVDQQGDEQTVEFAHEALPRYWPRLRAWLDEARDFLLWRKQLSQARAAYVANQRELLAGVEVVIARRWTKARSDQIEAADQSFLEESFTADDKRLAEEAKQASDVERQLRLLRNRSSPQQERRYISYAWADKSDPKRDELVEKFCVNASNRGLDIFRDKTTLNHGDLISAFMSNIGTGDIIYIFLSDKYLRSQYCMFELFEIWRNSRQDKKDFLRRVRFF
jgi:hypothetical protein